MRTSKAISSGSTNGGMTWSLMLAKPATRDLRKVPRPDVEHINAIFEEMRFDPYEGDVEFLEGTTATMRH
ncbi:MAG: hypothetical protein ACLQIQ_14055 [Beijerinckiaceae bacterium]